MVEMIQQGLEIVTVFVERWTLYDKNDGYLQCRIAVSINSIKETRLKLEKVECIRDA